MNSLKWKRRIAKLSLVRYSSNRKLILLYHAVGEGPQALSSDLFEQQMQWLKQACEVLPLTDLIQSKQSQNKTQVSIGFDDGYACLHEVAAPILSKYNFPATVYLNTGWIGDDEAARKASDADLGHYKEEKFLIWPEVEELLRQNWEIGSHGVDHLDLTKAPADIVKQQLEQSKQAIEAKLQKACPHFAYTWGRHTPLLQRAVEQANYQYAVAAHHAKLKTTDNPVALPRMNIEQQYSLDDFKNIVMGRWDYMGLIHKLKSYL